jgi:anti-sigma factor RsiW
MSFNLKHPEDFTCYLDRDFSDSRYEEIRAHLEGCAKCREELEIWRGIEAAFRSPELDIEVPPFLWQRIASRINTPPERQGWRKRITALALPRSMVWRGVAAVGLALVLTLTGVRFAKYRADSRILSMIGDSEPEWKVENPFQRLVEEATEENPFEEFLSSRARKAIGRN